MMEVSLPDGRSGWVQSDQLDSWDHWISTRNTNPETLISTAKQMMGVPYLWGGTSIKGMDCSGFTKTIFFLNGQIIPRDASQQVNEGEEIDTDKNWEKLEVGDLLFFGEKSTDEKKERVVHVGMWIGNGEFIHSRGRVRISSFDPTSPNYDEYELNRYLRTKRIINKQSDGVISVSQLLTNE
jgi:cell wall-associated NlpC family hydrolase